ncbi:unnamed protein product [Sphagnum jensenii]|uniref:peptidylprolyl isomerase n=1 Tax=Sphagnum jensenii TaxID=128206 RepID=A0ABP1BCB0_9BRYO
MALICSSLLLSAAPIPSSKSHLCTTSSHLITSAVAVLLAGGFVMVPPVADAEEDDHPIRPKFVELEDSGGVKVLDIREGGGTTYPKPGDRVEIHYYARLAAKQGWRFDATYDHKDASGNPEPYVFTIASGTVIAGLDAAVRSMREGGVRRVVIPPSQAYQNTTQGPIPPNFFDRQRLYTTVFNQTRLANGEGSTLGTVIFDVELLKIRPQ